MASVWQATGGLAPHRRALAGVGALLCVEAGLPAASLVLLERGLVAVDAGEARTAAAAMGGLFAVTAVASGAKLLRTAWSKGVAWRLAQSLRVVAHGRLLEDGDERTVGDRLALLSQEIDQVQLGVSAGVTLARDPVALVALGAAAVWLAPELALATVAALVPVGLAVWGSTRWVARAARDHRDARAALLGLAGEQLHGRDVVQAHGAAAFEGERFRELAEADRRARRHLDVVRGLPGMVTQTLGVAALGGVLVLGVSGLAGRTLPAASVLAFAAGLFLALRPLTALAEAGSLLRRARAALERVEQLLAQPRADWVHRPRSSTGGDLVVDAARQGGAVGPVTLHVPAGQWVALVGATGSGKTTVLRWLAGLQAPTDGRVMVGGADPRHVPPGERITAYVPQDSMLFARSVGDNVRLGRPDAGRSLVMEALRIAAAPDLAPDSALGPGGAPLSGGERQRVALARALLLDRDVWLLDEPTAHLDADTRDQVVAALRAERGHRTLVCATHDPELAAQADRVVLLEAGRVVSDGPPDRVGPRRVEA